MRQLFLLQFACLVALCAGCDAGPNSPSAPPAGKKQSGAATERKARPAATMSSSIPLDDPKGVVSEARNFYFVIDGSGSMAEKPSIAGEKRFGSKMEGAKWAVGEFLKQVPSDVNLGLFVFDQKGFREVVRLGPGNRAAFLHEVNAMIPECGTPLGEAITAGVNALVAQYKRQLGYGEYRLIVVTDGMSNGKIQLNDATAYADKYLIPLYTIGLCIGGDHELRKSSVSYRAADSIADLKKGLEEALAETKSFDAATFEAK